MAASVAFSVLNLSSINSSTLRLYPFAVVGINCQIPAAPALLTAVSLSADSASIR